MEKTDPWLFLQIIPERHQREDDFSMDWNCLLLILVIVCPFLYMIYVAFTKLRKLIITPLKRSKVFDDLENRDGFTKIRKDSEEHRLLNDILKEILIPLNENKPLSLKRAVFQKDDNDYYISDVEFQHLPGARYGIDPLLPNRYICLLINTPLNIPEPLKVSKKSYQSSTSAQEMTFDEKYSVFPVDSATKGNLLIRDVKEFFEMEDGKYPMTDIDSNEFPGPLGRSAIFCSKGVILAGNPDCNRFNIAEMVQFGKKLISMIRAITDNEEMS